MNRETVGNAIGYLWAVATVAVALTLQVLLAQWVEGAHVFLYFVPAVALTAWVAGTTPAIVATSLGALCGAFTLRSSLLQGSVADISGILLFAVACGAMIGVFEAQRKQVERDTAMQIGEKVAQEATAAVEKLDRTALDNTLDVGIVFLDNQRNVTEWNVGASHLTGWNRNEMRGRSLDTLYTDDEIASGEPRRQFVLAEAGGKLAISRKFRRKDAKLFHAEGTLRPVLDGNGFVSGFVLSFIDVTARVAAQSQIEARLMTRAEELESLSYSMAHDMRQYTRGMANNAKMLRDDIADSLDPSALEILDRIEFNGKRMHEMVEGILEHTKLSRTELNTKPIDLSKTARASANTISSHLDPAALAFDIQPDLWVRGDANMLELALNNLFENAAKYGGRHVRFGYDPVKEAYFVKDDGPGFKPEYSEKIFAVFHRLHGQDNPGTGIGLANVKTIIERHGGEIWAETEGEGKGATFYFSLKKAEEAPVGTLI